MSSIIEMKVVGANGESLYTTRHIVDYGDDYQYVLVVLDEPETIEASPSVEAFREVNDLLVERSILDCTGEEYDA